MRINEMPVVSFDDIECHFDTCSTDYNFTECAENDSYIFFSLDEDALNARQEELDYYRTVQNENRARKYANDIELQKYLNSRGYDDAILIYVCW